MNLKTIFPDFNWSVAYGIIYVDSPQSRKAQLRFGSNESIKVWLNDEEVWRENAFRDAVFDDDVVDVSLKSGLNKIVLKLCNRIDEWGFFFRITDSDGRGVPDLTFVPADEIQ